jgi:hypothetical protein
VIQAALLTAFHAHPAVVVTFTLPVPPPAEKEAPVALSAKLQPVPSCVTMKNCPGSVIVVCRLLPPGFALTEKPTLPLPRPLAPEVIMTHEALLTAVHEQVLVVPTRKLPAPPADPNN